MAKEAEIEEEVEGAEGAEGEQEPKKSKKKLFIIIGAAVLALLLVGGGAYFFLFSGTDEQAELVASAEPVFFYDMDPITVNLATSGAEDEVQKFLKISVSLELENESMMEIITPRMVRVQDAFQVYLRELRPSDLEGSAGIYRLKQELRKRVNLAIHPAKVDNILFKEILVQ